MNNDLFGMLSANSAAMEAPKKPFKGVQSKLVKAGVSLPCGLSFKIDGIRGMCYNGGVMSASGKPIPNRHIQYLFEQNADMLYGLDGELVVGEPTDKNLMQQCLTGVMGEGGTPDFSYWVFDDFTDLSLPFEQRYENYCNRVDKINGWLVVAGFDSFLRKVIYDNVTTKEEYEAKKQLAAELNYEGLYGKDWKGMYKHGRSGRVNPSCWKDKPWTDEEGVIVDFIEGQTNLNEAFIGELGQTKRSSHQENKVGNGMIGSFVVRNTKYKKLFNVSCGSMTHAERKAIWENRESYRNALMTYKFFDFGVVDVPRSAIFKCFRSKLDMDE